MDNGNDQPAYTPCLEFLMKNMIPTNSDVTKLEKMVGPQ